MDKKIPKLRFKEFTGEWEEKKLKKLFSFKQGYQIPFLEQSKEKKENFLRYLYITDFISDKNIIYVNSFEKERIKETDIVIANTGNTAGRFFRGKTGILSNNMFSIKNNEDVILSNFLYKFLETSNYDKQLKTFFNSSGQPHLGHKNMGEIVIDFPLSSKEQEKIANFLSSVDKKISLTEEKLELFKNYKKGIMQKIFSQKLRFKDENGNDYPEWKNGKIKDFGYFYYGKSAPKYSIVELGGTPCVRYGELYSTYNEYIKEVKSYTNIPISELKLSKGGEVLVPRVGEDPLDFAKCSYLPLENVAIGEMISVYNTNENGLFITYYFNATMKREFAKYVEGASVSNLYFTYLENIKICIPSSLKEQEKIANFLSSIDEKIEKIENELENLKEFKKGLLQQMFI